MSISAIYTYPVPKLADGTPATTSATSTSDIDDIRAKYLERLGRVSDGSDAVTYYGRLKAALLVLKDILDQYEGIRLDDLESTFSTLKSDAFYTMAQTIAAQRIDQNCREGFLAYRNYLKTIISTLDRIYGYLKDGHKALEALDGERDSDVAHTLITQLEIDEDFIYEEFQSLCTYYKYNNDTKQWDKIVLALFGDDPFVSQLASEFYTKNAAGNLVGKDEDGSEVVLQRNGDVFFKLDAGGQKIESEPVLDWKRDAQGYMSDADGNRIIENDGKYHVLNGEGKPTTEISEPVYDTVITCTYNDTDTSYPGKDEFPGGVTLAYGFFKENQVEGYQDIWKGYTKAQWFGGDWNGQFLVYPDVYCRQVGDHWILQDRIVDSETQVIRTDGEGYILDASGRRIAKLDGPYYKEENGVLIPDVPAGLRLRKDAQGKLIDADGDRILKNDSEWYVLDSRNQLTSEQSQPTPCWLRNDSGQYLDASGNVTTDPSKRIPAYATNAFGEAVDIRGNRVAKARSGSKFYNLRETSGGSHSESYFMNHSGFSKDVYGYWREVRYNFGVSTTIIWCRGTSDTNEYYPYELDTSSESEPMVLYERDAQGYLLDASGRRVALNGDGKYYRTDASGALREESEPVRIYIEKHKLTYDRIGRGGKHWYYTDTDDHDVYVSDEDVSLATDDAGYVIDEYGRRLTLNDGKYYLTDAWNEGVLVEIEPARVYTEEHEQPLTYDERGSNGKHWYYTGDHHNKIYVSDGDIGFLKDGDDVIDGQGYRLTLNGDDEFYRLETKGEESERVPLYETDAEGHLIDAEGNRLTKIGEYYALLKKGERVYSTELSSARDSEGYFRVKNDDARVILESSLYYKLSMDGFRYEYYDTVPDETFQEDGVEWLRYRVNPESNYYVECKRSEPVQAYKKNASGEYVDAEGNVIQKADDGKFYRILGSPAIYIGSGFLKIGNKYYDPSVLEEAQRVPLYRQFVDDEGHYVDCQGNEVSRGAVASGDDGNLYIITIDSPNNNGRGIRIGDKYYERDCLDRVYYQGRYVDADGDRLIEEDGRYYKLRMTDMRSDPMIPETDAQGYFLDASDKRLGQINGGADGKYYKVKAAVQESEPVVDYDRDADGFLVDLDGNRICTFGNTYHVLRDEGELSTSGPLQACLRDVEGYLIDNNGNRIARDGIYGGYGYGDYRVVQIEDVVSAYTPDVALGRDFDGYYSHKIDDDNVVRLARAADGSYHRVTLTATASNPVPLYWMDFAGELVDSEGYRLRQSDDGEYYRKDDPTVQSNPIPIYERSEDGYLINAQGQIIQQINFSEYHVLELQDMISAPVGPYKTDDSGHLIDASDRRIAKYKENNGTWNYYLTGEPSMTYAKLQDLRDTKVACTDSLNPEAKRALTVFNSVSLFDRLRYIRYYYQLILQAGATDYSVFPDDSEMGYPCLPDVESTKATEDTKSLGALEMFYVGYLIDRDGPINAISSFFEVKTSALRNNLSLQSKKIEALNIYLDFINTGMNRLNSSQNDKDRHRMPDGACIAITYLCGQNMYKLYEAPNGKKYLVLPNLRYPGKYNLFPADDVGKKVLLGDNVSAGNDWRGNNSFYIDTSNSKSPMPIYEAGLYSTSPNPVTNLGIYDEAHKSENIKVGVNIAPGDKLTDRGAITWNGGTANSGKDYNITTEELASADDTTVFKLPTEIECSKVDGTSVMYYGQFRRDDSNEHTSMVKSWTDALSKKTEFINTAIDSINTDVTVDRSKIDTLDSLTSTFRSRAQDAYLNTVANIRG